MLNKVSVTYYKAGFFLWSAVILFLTSFPNPNKLVESPPGADKVAHTAVYLILAVLFSGWMRRRNPVRPWWFIVLVLAAFGVLDELHQIPIPGRFFSWWDVAADLAGASAGCLLAQRIKP